jgi:hypothetical protein
VGSTGTGWADISRQEEAQANSSNERAAAAAAKTTTTEEEATSRRRLEEEEEEAEEEIMIIIIITLVWCFPIRRLLLLVDRGGCDELVLIAKGCVGGLGFCYKGLCVCVCVCVCAGCGAGGLISGLDWSRQELGKLLFFLIKCLN